MTAKRAPGKAYPEDEITSLVNTLDAAQQRLLHLAGGALDAVALPGGHVLLLHEAQEKLRESEAAQTEAAALQTSILNALPAFIALIDPDGVIISVNNGWRHFAQSNGHPGEGSGIGVNYLAVCQNARGERSEESSEAHDGIRAVLSGALPSFSLEYPCHSPTEQRWFRMTVSPMGDAAKGGAVIMHTDITEPRLAEERLRQSQAVLIMAGRIGRMGGWSMELPSLALTWSDEVRAIHQVPPDFKPTVESGIDFYAPECRGAIRAAVTRCMQHGVPFDLELQIINSLGMRRWVRAMGETHRDARGVSTGIHGAFQDITDRKAAEIELSRINRALKMLSRCNEALVRAESEMDLLGKICRLAVEAGGYRMAWVGYALDDDYGTIKPMAHAGVEGGYLREIKVSWSEHQATGLGPGGRAIRSGKAIVCDDISQDPAFAPFMRVARLRGYRGMICLPLCDSKRPIGILGLYSSEVKVTSPEELNLLQELANDLAFGILTLRARAGQKRLESAVVKVASSVSAATGDHFLKQLARGMAEAVGAQAGFVAQFLPGEPLTARTLAAVVEGRMMDSFTYVIKDTPCETLRNSGSCVIARGVAPLLPPGLEALNAQGYVGWRLDSSKGEPLGQLSVVFREPLQETDFITSTIQIFAARAASEMERNQTDARVRDQAALLENAREAIIERDLEHRILFWNRGAERLYGWTAAEAVGRSATDLLFKDPAPVIAAVKATVAEGSWDGELHQVNKQEQPLIVEGHYTLVRDASGNPKSILSIGTDITERKNMEEQFFRAQRLDSIGTLASGLAHDLNNILAPIMMCAPMLRMGLPPAEFESLLRGIEISAERGAQIVRQVLTFGRGVQGERAPLQIGKIIQEIVQIAGETFPKSIRIEPSIAPDLSGIMGDITQWHQVLMNLCVNARDAMADGGVLRVTADNLAVDTHYASMTPGLAEGPHVIIEVSDTGAGIPPDVVSRIFDPFFTTKAVGKGTGLGLSTVLGIVRNHGGAISVDTHPGLGTTFRILIPSTAESASLAASNPQAPIPRGNGQLILIADDEPNVRNAARQVLERQGYRTLLAADGIEAIALFAKHADTIVAVLTDIAMPRMDGIALITAMLRIRPGTPIIASTGEGGKARTDAIKELGVATLLLKPYKAEILLRAIDAAITKSAPTPDFHGWDV